MFSGRFVPPVISLEPKSTHSTTSVPGLPRPSPSVSSQKVTSADVPLHTPAQSSVEVPPQIPAQSVSTTQLPSQSKFVSGYSQEPSSVNAFSS